MRARSWLYLVVALAAGCGATHGMSAADGGTSRAQSGGRAAVDAHAMDAGEATANAGAGGATPARPPVVGLPTSIVVENVGRQAILLDPDCGAVWLKLYRAGVELDITRYCDTPCDRTLPQGCPAICQTTSKVLPPRARKTFAWSGVFSLRALGQSCEEYLTPEKSTDLTATVCWDTMLPWSAAPECASATFKYGETAELVIRAQREEVTPRTTKLVLTNTLDRPVEIDAEVCGNQAVFGTEKNVQGSLGVGCICSCESQQSDGQCWPPACGACAPNVVQQLKPGESFEYAWDQHLWNQPSAERCWMNYALAPDDALPIRACWREAGASPVPSDPGVPGSASDCKTLMVKGTDKRVTFATGEAEVDAGL